MSARCPYEVLEVAPGSSFAEIRRAYERVRAIFGPTSLAVYSLASPEEQRAALHEIEEAYRILSDPEARKEYDLENDHPPPSPEEEGPALERARLRPIHDSPTDTAAERPEAPPVGREERMVLPVETAPPPVPLEALSPPGPAEVAPVAPPRPAPSPQPPPLPTEAASGPEMPMITEDTVFSGPLLRAVREARGLTLREIGERTKISPTHLESIEEERWSWLPARVFLRGFLISLARELRLDPDQVSRTFLERRERAG